MTISSKYLRILLRKVKRRLLFVLFIFLFGLKIFPVFTQEVTNQLPNSIQESSALILIGDSVFITLNDSGNESELFVLNARGELIHTCKVLNAKNVDWEALTFDGRNTLFIGDFGNNKNKRKDLAIYKVPLLDVLNKTTARADQLSFQYPDQELFPPREEELYFDAEALFFQNDSLYIVTKNRTKPFDGLAKMYRLNTVNETQKAVSCPPIFLPPTAWFQDCVTDACLWNGKLYLLTYAYIYACEKNQNQWEVTQKWTFEHATQKEGLTVNESYFYLTDESSKFGEGNLYHWDKVDH